ncbi:MAG: hypothetical protein GY711_21085 [bacterium]|nr:hypothetical protein [bacterium]
MRILLHVGAALAITATCYLYSSGAPAAHVGPLPDIPHTACATGCAAAAPAADELSESDFSSLLRTLANEPEPARSEAFETLLFHGRRALEMLASRDGFALDAELESVLRRELARTHATLNVRLVDEDGFDHLRLGEQRLILGTKRHLFANDALALKQPEVSGTVRRVGAERLWARL